MKTVVSACMAVCLGGMVGGCIMAPYGTYGTYQTYPASQTYQTTTTTVQPPATGVPGGTNGPAPAVTTTVVTVPAQAPAYYYYAEPSPVYVWPWYPGIWIGGRGGCYGGRGRGWR